MQTRLAAVSSLFVVVATARAATVPPPTMEELRAMRDAGKYADVIAACQRVAGTKDDAAYPRHEVRMILADGLLHLKRSAQAIETLKAEATAAQKANAPADADEAAALAMLIRASPTLAYAPTTGDGRAPIDIVAADSRIKALARLFDDRVAACRAMLNAASGATSLAPLQKVATAFADVRALEHVNDHAAADADALGHDLSTWADQVTEQVLDHADDEVKRIAKGPPILNDEGQDERRRRRVELDSSQIAQLKQLAGDCSKLPATVAEMTKSFAGNATTKPTTPGAEHAAKTVDRIKQILDENDRLQEARRTGGWRY